MGVTWPGAEGADESGDVVIVIVIVFVFVIVFVIVIARGGHLARCRGSRRVR